MWGPPAGLAAAEADSSAATTATATAAATAAAAAGGDPIAAGSFSHSPLCGTWPLNPSWDLGRGLRWGGEGWRSKKEKGSSAANGEGGGGRVGGAGALGESLFCYPFCPRFYRGKPLVK